MERPEVEEVVIKQLICNAYRVLFAHRDFLWVNMSTLNVHRDSKGSHRHKHTYNRPPGAESQVLRGTSQESF